MTTRSPHTFVVITHSLGYAETTMRIHKFRTEEGENPSLPITTSAKIRIERLIERKRLVFTHVHITPHKLAVFYHLGYMGPLEDEEDKS